MTLRRHGRCHDATARRTCRSRRGARRVVSRGISGGLRRPAGPRRLQRGPGERARTWGRAGPGTGVFRFDTGPSFTERVFDHFPQLGPPPPGNGPGALDPGYRVLRGIPASGHAADGSASRASTVDPGRTAINGTPLAPSLMTCPSPVLYTSSLLPPFLSRELLSQASRLGPCCWILERFTAASPTPVAAGSRSPRCSFSPDRPTCYHSEAWTYGGCVTPSVFTGDRVIGPRRQSASAHAATRPGIVTKRPAGPAPAAGGPRALTGTRARHRVRVRGHTGRARAAGGRRGSPPTCTTPDHPAPPACNYP